MQKTLQAFTWLIVRYATIPNRMRIKNYLEIQDVVKESYYQKGEHND